MYMSAPGNLCVCGGSLPAAWESSHVGVAVLSASGVLRPRSTDSVYMGQPPHMALAAYNKHQRVGECASRGQHKQAAFDLAKNGSDFPRSSMSETQKLRYFAAERFSLVHGQTALGLTKPFPKPQMP